MNDEIKNIEIQIYEAKRKKTEQESAILLAQIKFKQEYENKFFGLLSQKMDQHIDKNNIKQIDIPDSMWGETMDEVSNRQNDLIKPSHSLLPYSIIQQEPILKEYLPYQSRKNGLALLADKSTSRAYEIVHEYSSENTEKAHNGDLVYIHAWLSVTGHSFTKPITENEIIKFIIQHAEGLNSEDDQKLVEQGFKSKLGIHSLATIKRRVASLSVFLDRAKWPNECHNKIVKELLTKLTKKYGCSKSNKAITRDILDKMLETTNQNKLIDIRDRALLLFAWSSGGRRRSEVASAEYKDLIPVADYYKYEIPKSKTDQEGKGYTVPIKGRASMALTQWLTITGIKDGKIFRGISKGGKILQPISDVDVFRIVRKRLKKAGIQNANEFGAHSLRSGFVTEGAKRGKNLGDIMQMSTHRSVATVMRYYKAGDIENNPAANLAD